MGVHETFIRVDWTDWQSRLDTADLKGPVRIEMVLSFYRQKQTKVKISFCVAPHCFTAFYYSTCYFTVQMWLVSVLVPSVFFPCNNSEKMEKKKANEMCFIWHDMQWTKEAPGPVSPGLSSAFIDRPPWNYRLRMRPLLRCGFWPFFLSLLLPFFLFFPPLFEPPPPPPPAVGALPWDRDLLMYDRYGWLWVDQSRSSRWMAPVKPFIRLRAEAFQKGPDMEEVGIPSWLFLYSPQCVCEGLFWRGRLTLPHVKLSNKDEAGSRMNSVHAGPSRP